MPTRNTTELKKLLYNRLKNDTTLTTLLGGANKIRHANPMKVSAYPCLVYNLIGEMDNPYHGDRPTGISTSEFQIEVFAKSTDATVVDKVEARVYELLHDQKFSNSNVQVKTCFRTRRTPIFEENIDIYRLYMTYELTNVANSPISY